MVQLAQSETKSSDIPRLNTVSSPSLLYYCVFCSFCCANEPFPKKGRKKYKHTHTSCFFECCFFSPLSIDACDYYTRILDFSEMIYYFHVITSHFLFSWKLKHTHYDEATLLSSSIVFSVKIIAAISQQGREGFFSFGYLDLCMS